MNGPQPGMRVVGIRGALVGYVLAIQDGCIEVDPEGDEEAFWLRKDAVIGVDGDRVELICDASEVHRYRLESPAG